MELAGKKITVIGAAKSGQSVARILKQLGSVVKISEAAPAEKIEPAFRTWAKKNKISIEFGGHTKSFITDSDLVVLSPGVPINAKPVLWARGRKIPVWGEIELGFRLCKKPVIAITGSNGKTTVSTLIKLIIDAGGKRGCLCGNIGQPFSQFALKSEDYDYFVVEISSFQLETIVDFKPLIAVFLNFSQNHLDRHADLKEYFDAKKRIFLNQDKNDFAVLNAQDKRIKTLGPKLEAKVQYFNERQSGRNPNHLAVLEVGKILKIPQVVCNQVLKSFGGVEHRLEHVRSLDQVHYINDSKATTVEAGRWALQNMQRPTVMICGGRDKHLDFSVLRSLVKKKVKSMIVFGEAKEKLHGVFRKTIPVYVCADLIESVTTARQLAAPGDNVLLCPMCTSFDMFKNFEDRGRTFKAIVKGLKD